MNRALLFLVTRSLVNSIAFRLRRLKRPKYLAGAVFGALYFYVYFFRFLIRGGQASSNMPALPIDELGVEIGSLILFAVVIVFSWIWPGSRAALAFTEAEITWLFPAPLNRAALIRFKLLKSQLGLLLLAALMTVLTGRVALGPTAWMRVAGWWIVFSTLQMHRLGASFALQRLMHRGLSDWKRRWIFLAVFAGLATTIYFWRISAPNLPEIHSSEAFLDWLRSFLQAGPAPWLLLPFRVLLQPWFAADFSGFLLALPAALLLMVLHYFWVIHAHVSFEEASVALSQRRAAFIAARRSGDMRLKQTPQSANVPAFHLSSTGFEPLSFFWKHLIATGGRRSLLRWLLASAMFIGLAFAFSATGRWPVASFVLIVVAVALFIIATFVTAGNGSQAVRRDLLAIDLLKTFPIPGWKILLGELIGPAFGGTLLQILSLSVIVISLGAIPEFDDSIRQMLPVSALSIALLAPAINLTLMIIPTAATLILPAWFKSGDAATPGLETMGLRIIMVFGQFLALLLALIPAAILGFLAWMSAQMFDASASAPFAGAAVAAITLGIEACMGIVCLGRLFDQFDPSES